MSIFEYDEKLHERTMMDIGREEGLLAGVKALVITLHEMNYSNESIVQQLVDKLEITEEKAKEYLELSLNA